MLPIYDNIKLELKEVKKESNEIVERIWQEAEKLNEEGYHINTPLEVKLFRKCNRRNKWW